MKTIHVLILAFGFCGLLSGCGSDVPFTPIHTSSILTKSTSTATRTPSPKPLSSPTPNITKTASQDTPTPEFHHEPFPNNITEAMIDFLCLDISLQSPGDVSSTGLLVLESREMIEGLTKPETFFLEMTTGRLAQVSENEEFRIYHTVSPNRELLAYKSIRNRNLGENSIKNLMIVTSNGSTVASIPWEKGWVGPIHWLNDETLVLPVYGLDPEADEAKKAGPLQLINIVSSERQILWPEFPGIYSLFPIPYWEGWSLRIYDPSLSRASYIRITEEGDVALALWDNQKKMILANLYTTAFSIPSWSPDGQYLVTNASVKGQSAQELFIISFDGKIDRVTNLGAYAEKGAFFNYSWSPDGNYIATWIIKNPPWEEKEVELAILDLRTRRIKNYCVKVKYGSQEGYATIPPAPIWSPDSQQMVFFDWYHRDHSRVIMLDRILNFAIQIATDKQPMGWMLSP